MFIKSLCNSVYHIDQGIAESYLPLITSLLKGTYNNNIDHSAERTKNKAYASDKSSGSGEVLIIPMNGVLTQEDQFCGPAGTDTIEQYLLNAYKNPNIKSVVLSIDGPGGDASAMFNLVNVIEQRNKPVVAWVHSLCASAHYGVASSCDTIIVSKENDRIGSIGTYLTYYDFSGFFEKEGIKVIEEYADLSTDKNKAYRDAISGNRDKMKEMVNKYNSEFLSIVNKGRGKNIITEKGSPFTGDLYFAREAFQLGLFDSYGTLDDAILASINLSDNYKTQNDMFTKIKVTESYPALHSIVGDEVKSDSLQLIESAISELTQNNVDLSAKIEELTAGNNTLNSSLTELQSKHDAQVALNAELQAKIDNTPGAKTTVVNKEKDMETDPTVSEDTIEFHAFLEKVERARN